MDLQITLQNFRAFPNDAPIALPLSDGITFLLGVNNVGKSTLLRAFFELRPLFDSDGELRNARIKPQTYDVGLPNTFFDRLAHRTTPLRPIVLTVQSQDGGWRFELRPNSTDSHTNACRVQVSTVGTPSDSLVELVTRIYRKSMYIGSFRSPAAQVSDALFDINIGRQFIAQWDSWANGTRVDHARQTDLLTEELRTLFGFQRLSISVSEDKTQLYLTTDEGRFSLSELGDGIAHYVIVLGNAMIRHPSFIFIDEPEIGLHPRMQEVFVRALASKAELGLIATSHSVGLARSSADKILTITRESSGRRRCVPFGQHRSDTLIQSISELGYSQYAEMGGNHLLLVEGRTDIKAFREILRKFHLEQHFIIWSLNGSDWLRSEPSKVADELNELKRLNARSISVVFDSERTGPDVNVAPYLEPFLQLCLSLGFNAFPTDRHSTENYITQNALDAIAPGHKALTPYEAFGANSPKWEKSKNWLLFQKMDAADFDSTALKTFILGTLKPLVEMT